MIFRKLSEQKKDKDVLVYKIDGRTKLINTALLKELPGIRTGSVMDVIMDQITKQLIAVNTEAFCVTYSTRYTTYNLDVDFDVYAVYDSDNYKQKYWYYDIYSVRVSEYENDGYGVKRCTKTYDIGHNWKPCIRHSFYESKITA